MFYDLLRYSISRSLLLLLLFVLILFLPVDYLLRLLRVPVVVRWVVVRLFVVVLLVTDCHTFG